MEREDVRLAWWERSHHMFVSCRCYTLAQMSCRNPVKKIKEPMTDPVGQELLTKELCMRPLWCWQMLLPLSAVHSLKSCATPLLTTSTMTVMHQSMLHLFRFFNPNNLFIRHHHNCSFLCSMAHESLSCRFVSCHQVLPFFIFFYVLLNANHPLLEEYLGSW